MRLWKKIYLTTLILFLVLLNGGIYMVFHMTYNKDLRVEQNRCEASFDMIESSLERNMEILNREGLLDDKQIRTLIEGYENYFERNNVKLKIWKENKCIYPKEEKRDKSLFKKETVQIKIVNQNKTKKILLTKEITGFDNNYYFYYEQPLKELSDTWTSLQKRYLYMSFGSSIFLAIVLFFILQSLMRPIRELTVAVEKMKNGEDTSKTQVKVRGKDDIAKLGQKFNEMSDTIAQNMAQMQEETEKKQQFIDNFAHELKSPLTSIYGFAEYIDKANVSESEKKECMQFIMEESNRMLQLSYTLLDMAKLRGIELEMKKIEARSFCEKIAVQMKVKLREKNIRFFYETDEIQLYGNDILLQTMIVNFITNAIHASEEGSEIILTITRDGKNGILKIKDKGCGMTNEQISHVFEPFYRVDKARSRENGGTGLGLSLCNQIVQVHQGTITIDSKPQCGTCVTVTIPL